jgi:hypothetical protein
MFLKITFTLSKSLAGTVKHDVGFIGIGGAV